MPEAEAVTTVTFTGKDGRTTINVLVQHTSREHRDAHINSGLEIDMQGQMDLLEVMAVNSRADAAAALRPSLEVALAQGFKYAANLRRRPPYAYPEAMAYLAERALEMLRTPISGIHG